MTDRSTVSATAPRAGAGILRGGLDLGGTKIQAVVVDDTHAVLGDARRPTPTTGGPPDVAAAMAETLRDAAGAAGADPGALGGVGVGAPGGIDASAGTVSNAGNLPDWARTYPLGPVLRDLLGVPVVLANDVEVATSAEFELGAGRPYRSLIGVFCGTGVGGGIVLDGRTWVGRGAAGEIGHLVVQRDGARCTCGRRGCMEAYAGRGAMELEARRRVEQGQHTSLFRIMEKRGRTRLSSGVFARALAKGDPMAVDLIQRAVGALGAGIASAVNLLDVEAVIVGGGLGLRLGTPFVERIREAAMAHLFMSSRPPAMHLAELGDLGGAVGATLSVADAVAVG